MDMEKIIRGVHTFQDTYFSANRDYFKKLIAAQLPRALFITCSDSRVVPNLITQTEPGELFILRNAGNIIPPYGASNGGEGATIEYAVTALGVKQLIVCGHTHCGAMGGLLHPEKLSGMPTVASWLKFAETTKRIVESNYADLDEDSKLLAAIKENVLVQMENLRTHPAIAVRLSRGDLNLYAWVYQIETGIIYSYDTNENRYVPLTRDSKPVPIDTRSKLNSADIEEMQDRSIAG